MTHILSDTDWNELIGDLEALQKRVWESAQEAYLLTVDCQVGLCPAVTGAISPEKRREIIRRRSEPWGDAVLLVQHLRVTIETLRRYRNGTLVPGGAESPRFRTLRELLEEDTVRLTEDAKGDPEIQRWVGGRDWADEVKRNPEIGTAERQGTGEEGDG